MKSKKTAFRGTATALVTPFRDGQIDYTALRNIIEMQISAGIDALVIGGTTAEAATLTDLEREELYNFSAYVINHRTALILGTGTNDTATAVRHARLAERVECDAMLVVTPYYNKGTEEGIYRHYCVIADSVSVPMILYNVPSRTGVNLGYPILLRLSENEKVIGLKEASDSVDRLVSLADFRDTLPLYAGNDSQILPTLALGGAGVISVISNVLPKSVKALTDAYFFSDTATALDIQLKLLSLIRALFLETNPAPIKHLMSTLGLISPELRLPLAEVRDSTKKILSEEYEALIHQLGEGYIG